jgi:hypothetical protein
MDMLAYFLGRLAGNGTNGGSEGGIVYSSIEYQKGENNNDVILFTDENGIEHIMNCTYDSEGKITGLTYDSKTVELEYEGNELINIDDITINLKDVPKKSYADDLCEYFNIDKTTYPYIAVVVLETGKTRLMCSAEPVLPGKEVPHLYNDVNKTTGLEGETRASVVFGWFKGYKASGAISWKEGVTSVYVMRGTWFANYPIEEVNGMKYYPL